MDPTNERWQDPPPRSLILGMLSFSVLGFARDWRLGFGLLVFLAACVGIRWLLVLRYRRAVEVAGQTDPKRDKPESA